MEVDHFTSSLTEPESIGADSVRKRRRNSEQRTLFGLLYHPLLDELRALDMDHMTPTGAFEALQKLRSRLGAR